MHEEKVLQNETGDNAGKDMIWRRLVSPNPEINSTVTKITSWTSHICWFCKLPLKGLQNQMLTPRFHTSGFKPWQRLLVTTFLFYMTNTAKPSCFTLPSTDLLKLFAASKILNSLLDATHRHLNLPLSTAYIAIHEGLVSLVIGTE